ncbi:hypothetical protein ACIQZG_10865 [Lysinibacillus sp. NPDC096418]|uniref:hypothetical protein n=1 Tax=Lysinibacillus sp. NPDC096418 TaxID=3364138 RepID=UPI0037F94CC4
MKRIFLAPLAYLMTGMGCYHTFFGNNNIYGIIILIVGLIGVWLDITDKKVKFEKN